MYRTVSWAKGSPPGCGSYCGTGPVSCAGAGHTLAAIPGTPDLARPAIACRRECWRAGYPFCRLSAQPVTRFQRRPLAPRSAVRSQFLAGQVLARYLQRCAAAPIHRGRMPGRGMRSPAARSGGRRRVRYLTRSLWLGRNWTTCHLRLRGRWAATSSPGEAQLACGESAGTVVSGPPAVPAPGMRIAAAGRQRLAARVWPAPAQETGPGPAVAPAARRRTLSPAHRPVHRGRTEPRSATPLSAADGRQLAQRSIRAGRVDGMP